MNNVFNFIYSILSNTETNVAANYLSSKYNLAKDSNTFKKNIGNILKHIIVGNTEKHLDKIILENENKQLKINYYRSKENSLKAKYNFISFILDNFKDINYLISLDEIDKWKDIVYIYININPIDYTYNFEFPNREMFIAKTLDSVYVKKYNFKIENGSVKLEKHKIEKVIKEIESLIIELGGFEVINNIFSYLRKNYFSEKYQRYFLPKNYYQPSEKVELAVPFNFLINLSLKNLLIKNKKCKFRERKYKYLINLTRYFIFLYDLQDFYSINPNMFPKKYNIDLVYKNILYDNLFRFNQMGGNVFDIIFRGLLHSPHTKEINQKLGFTISEYMRLVKKIIKIIRHTDSWTLSKDFFSHYEISILDKISHCREINKNYFLPINFDKIENPFFLKPLIKNNDEYFLMDYCYCAWGFYEVILHLLEYKFIDVGLNIENIIKNKLKNTDFKFHFGKYMNSDRECDLVIEEQNVIFFIEIKKKAITRRSLSGNRTQIAVDLIDIFMHSQEQLLSHELFIKRHKEMNFKNGTKLKLENRIIEKISVSLFDNYSLNDHLFTMNLFDFLQNIQFYIKENDNSEEYMKIKKSIKEKNSKIINIINGIKELYADNGIEYKKDRFNIWFLSLELMLTFINEAVRNNKSLSNILQMIKNASAGTGDVYYEYDYFSTNFFND